MSIIVNGYELDKWKTSNLGYIAIATKGGKKYFLKKYQTPVEPIDNGLLDEKTLARNKKKFARFCDIHMSVNSKLRAISGEGGNIICPIDEFVFEHHFIEVSNFISGGIPDDEVLPIIEKLSEKERNLLMRTAAGALHSVHLSKIVHSDLKPKNILLVKNTLGNYVNKLVDFDASYVEGMAPEELVGTNEYMSPELAVAKRCEDDEKREKYASALTTKSDIFSLGLIYHVYLTGELPEAINLPDKLQAMKDKGKAIHAWVALSRGANIEISPKITNPIYRSLIEDMLDIEPTKRPTAIEVLSRLKMVGRTDKTSKEEKTDTKVDTTTLHSGWPKPWPEHGITFNIENLQAKGFVSGVQIESAGIHGYKFYKKEDTKGQFIRVEMLQIMQCASKVTVDTSGTTGGTKAGTAIETVDTTSTSITAKDEPWPEHNIVFDNAAMLAKKVIKIEPAEKNGVHGYHVYYDNKNVRFMTANVLTMQSLARKK